MVEPDSDSLILVSIIVPVFNSQENLGELLRALAVQELSFGKYEIIVVDNNSTDATFSIAKKCGVRVFSELKKGSYSARNKGIREAVGGLLVFIDGDCLPQVGWLEALVGTALDDGADMVTSYIEFELANPPTIAELYDSLVSLQVEDLMSKRQVAVTASLLIKARVFDAVGFFDEKLQSGGDILFSQNAVSQGFSLVLNKDSVVFHPARKLSELLSKHRRTSVGKMQLSCRESIAKSTRGTRALHLLFPFHLVKKFRSRYPDLSKAVMLKVLLLHYWVLWESYIARVKYLRKH